MKIDKITRVLYLYHILREGKKINKRIFSLDFEVSERGFDRDVQDIRLMLSEMGIYDELIFDKSDGTYYIPNIENKKLDEQESYILGKLLLDSKSIQKTETSKLFESILSVTNKFGRKN